MINLARVHLFGRRISISIYHVRIAKYVSRSSYYPHNLLYDDQYIKGHLKFDHHGELKMRHPVIRKCSIHVNNSSINFLECTVIVKLRPVRDWLIRKSHSQSDENVTVAEYFDKLTRTQRKRLELDKIPSTMELSQNYHSLYDLFHPVADIFCFQPPKVPLFPHYRWVKMHRFKIDGEEEITCIESSYDALLKVNKEDESLYDLNGPHATYLANDRKLLTRSEVRPMSHLNIDIANILKEYGIRDVPFRAGALKELPKKGQSIDDEIPKRRDFRHLCVFSVDPPTAKDIDDALHIRPTSEAGLFEVGIHIADVSHYVKYNSKLCGEAYRRGNTVYLENRAIHMLPSELSEDVCSLHPGSPKLTMSVVCEMNSNGEVVGEPWIGQGVISSCAKLTYKQCDDMIMDQNPVPEVVVKPSYYDKTLVQNVKLLNSLAVKMRNRRIKQGALAIGDEKVELKFDSSDECALTFLSKAHSISGKLIEEFMLLANTSVAKFLKSKISNLAFLRVHPKPTGRKINSLREVFFHLDVPFASASSQQLQQSMEELKSKLCMYEDSDGAEEYSHVMSYLFIRSLNLAEYTVPDARNSDLWHFGLAVPLYTHFTSPIRRFSDIIVHYQLKAILGIKGYPFPDRGFLLKSARRCNEARTQSRLLAMQLHEYYLWNLIQGIQGEKLFLPVYITRFDKNYIHYFCPATGYGSSIDIRNQKDVLSYEYSRKKDEGATITFTPGACQHQRTLNISLLNKVVCRFYKGQHMRLKTALVPPTCYTCTQNNFFPCTKHDVLAGADRRPYSSLQKGVTDSAVQTGRAVDTEIERKNVLFKNSNNSCSFL